MNFRGHEIDPIKLWQEYVELPPNASEDEGPFLPLVYCPNPEHDNTRSPAFQINVRQPTVHCFSKCGISGSYEHAIGKIRGIPEKRARKEILRAAGTRGIRRSKGARRTSIRDQRKNRALAVQQASQSFEDALRSFSYLPQVALEYLDSRGIGGASVSKWRIGFNPDSKRIVIPAEDDRERIHFLIERAIRPKDFPKYLYSEGGERNSLLFGACHANKDRIKSEGIILVEGSLDCIRLHQEGFDNAVAMLGTFSKEQIRRIEKLRPKRIYCFFDRDTAGVWAVEAIQRSFGTTPIFVLLYPKGKNDPAEMDGKEVERQLERALTITQFFRKAGKTKTDRSKENAR